MTESIKQPEAKRLADELERPVGTQSTYSAMQQAAAELRRLHGEAERLRAQLPAGMQHCTIVFEQCAKGHGNLTATNWVRHPCLVCALDELRAEVERLRAELARRMDEAHIQRFAALFAEAERMRIRKELNTLRWMGHDEGWDLAVEAIRKWLEGDAKSNFAKNATVHTTTLPLLREPGVFAGGASQAVVSGKTMEPK
jgi:hypothetical protein